jgi:branched-chain amino acid transport system ATP-binding protein
MLQIDELSAAYGAATVLEGISLTVGDGEAVAVLGRNGVGKTSLVRTLLGLESPRQRLGSITWQDGRIEGLNSSKRARLGLGLVPQGRHVFGSMTVEENLTTTARKGDTNPAWGLTQVYDFFPRLEERRRSRARNLSGGEQQMLAIGRALMTNPRMLVMDEPSEGLAPAVINQIRDRLLALKGGDLSILLVEQNLGLALALADRVYILETGRIAWSGAPAQLRDDPALQRRYLGV